MARGQLRIYLGAAPGVGKTFAMLEEAQRRAGRGTDLVIGFVETHGRPHTAEMLDDLEVDAAPGDELPRAPGSPRWTSTPSSRRNPQVARRRRAGAHQRARLPQREALAGHPGAAGSRDHRALHRQHPAPGVAQRRRRADHRRRRSGRPSPTSVVTRGGPGRARRHDARGAAAADGARQRLPAGEGRRGAGQLLPGRQPHRAARAGPALAGRQGRRAARPVPRRAPHRHHLGGARAGRGRADRWAARATR